MEMLDSPIEQGQHVRVLSAATIIERYQSISGSREDHKFAEAGIARKLSHKDSRQPPFRPIRPVEATTM